MPVCHIAFGGNLGSTSESFDRAVDLLNSSGSIPTLQFSSMYRTEAVGDNVGGEFLNAAAVIETNLEPLPLLQMLQSIETTLGRKREVHWGPRTIDLDLIFYGDRIVDLPGLRVPHPACWYRRFVLDPLVEVAADFVHPEKRCTVQQLRERLLTRPFRLALAGADQTSQASLIATLKSEFPDVEFSHGPCPNRSTAEEPTVIVGLDGPDEYQTPGASVANVSRGAWLDASAAETDPASFVRDVLRSALGRSQRVVKQ